LVERRHLVGRPPRRLPQCDALSQASLFERYNKHDASKTFLICFSLEKPVHKQLNQKECTISGLRKYHHGHSFMRLNYVLYLGLGCAARLKRLKGVLQGSFGCVVDVARLRQRND
jgi:hypothetical protein